MRELTVAAPAPEGLGVEMIGVPTGSPLDIAVRLESVVEGVLATGGARVPLAGECARCLNRFEDDLDVAFQELYVYPESEASEDEAARLHGELLDLEPAVRDAVVLALPFQPVCRPDCPGLCVEYGAVLADDPGHTHSDSVDPRWDALVGLQFDGSAARAAGEEEE